jgi:hypothetical protein
MTLQKRILGSTGFDASVLGIGDLADRAVPMETCVATIRRAMDLPRLTVAECLHYTLTIGPDVALLGLSFPNEQDAAFEALGSFRPLTQEQMEKTRRRAAQAIEGKGPCWWNPDS